MLTGGEHHKEFNLKLSGESSTGRVITSEEIRSEIISVDTEEITSYGFTELDFDVQENGTLFAQKVITYSGQTITVKVSITPTCEEGCKFDKWEINGSEYVAGSHFTLNLESTITGNISYSGSPVPPPVPPVPPEPPTPPSPTPAGGSEEAINSTNSSLGSAAQTGDMNFVVVAGLCVCVLGAGIYILRKRNES